MFLVSPDLSTFISGDVPVPHRAINLWSEQNNTPGKIQLKVHRLVLREQEDLNTFLEQMELLMKYSVRLQYLIYIFLIFVCSHSSYNEHSHLVLTPVVQGSKITGATSGATGFIHSTSSTKINLINVVGSFSTGEKIVSSSSQESDQILAQSGNATDITISSLVVHNFDAVKSLYMDGTGTGGDFTRI